jgi:hypothetical protein
MASTNYVLPGFFPAFPGLRAVAHAGCVLCALILDLCLAMNISEALGIIGALSGQGLEQQVPGLAPVFSMVGRTWVTRRVVGAQINRRLNRCRSL